LKKTEYGNQWTVKCTCGFPFGFTFFDRRNAITEWNRYIERMFLAQKHKAELKSLQEEEAVFCAPTGYSGKDSDYQIL